MTTHLKKLLTLAFGLLLQTSIYAQTAIWSIFEKEFTSSRRYENPLYDLSEFKVEFESPTGKLTVVSGFWDGDNSWKVRFKPGETGNWKFRTLSSDTTNTGLHKIRGSFECIPSGDKRDLYSRGAVIRPRGSYYLMHSDGSPFFYTACTAWNGPLKSTDEEWEAYLTDRVRNNYNVIQFTTTQWRGLDKNSRGEVAFEGSGKIKLNPDFFKFLDKKIDAINRHGLVAAPVLLWALQTGRGRELSPGYHLPDQEAILLARYMVARYGAHHVIWLLGGDGNYVGPYEQRWKNIGRAVFGGEHAAPVALHSQGGSWIGKVYASEDWLDIIGYQTGHNARPNTINWITKGPVSQEWASLPAKVYINMEPCYEDILPSVTAKEVRNASYWSLFSTPVAGITYGANAIWPWIRKGEEILNHSQPAYLRTWDESIRLPGSVQIGRLRSFMIRFRWWELKPAPELLMEQADAPEGFISVVRSDDQRTIMAYSPVGATVKLRNTFGVKYRGLWFDPETGQTTQAAVTQLPGKMEIKSVKRGDLVLVLERE